MRGEPVCDTGSVDEPARDVLDRRLTRREAEVLDAVAERLTNAQIARRLNVSERTVESHVSSLLRKLGAHSRTDLVGRSGSGVRERVSRGRLPYQLEAVAQRSECFGRDDERRRLLACWDRSAAGVTVAVIRGEAGIGKSRLAAAVGAEVLGRGGRVVLGTCLDGPQRPYEPFLAPIADELSRLPDGELRRQLGTWGSSLARVSSDLAVRLAVDRHEVVDPEHERAAVHAALHGFLAQAARRHRMLFVIEDLHWASSATKDAVAHIARVGGDVPLMLLVTTRDERHFIADGLGAFFGRVEALSSVEMVSLSGLDAAAAARVIDAVGGDVDSAQACCQTGGNPLFLRELARQGQGSRSLHELVNARFEQCSSSDLDVLDMAAIVGEQIDVPLVAAALDRTVEDVLDTLERAEAIGLIGAGAAPGHFAFTHDVFRSVRAALLTSSRTMRLHAAVARALERRSSDDRDIAERARHACLAAPSVRSCRGRRPRPARGGCSDPRDRLRRGGGELPTRRDGVRSDRRRGRGGAARGVDPPRSCACVSGGSRRTTDPRGSRPRRPGQARSGRAGEGGLRDSFARSQHDGRRCRTPCSDQWQKPHSTHSLRTRPRGAHVSWRYSACSSC